MEKILELNIEKRAQLKAQAAHLEKIMAGNKTSLDAIKAQIEIYDGAIRTMQGVTVANPQPPGFVSNTPKLPTGKPPLPSPFSFAPKWGETK